MTGIATQLDVASAGRFEGRTHLLPVRVYYEDTDFSGVVYHANYLRFLERGRSDCLRAAGIGHAALLERETPLAFAIMDMRISFRRPARIDDSLLVRTEYEKIAGARLMINQTITRDGELLVEAAVEACCIELGGRPRRFPKELATQLAPLLRPDAPAQS